MSTLREQAKVTNPIAHANTSGGIAGTFAGIIAGAAAVYFTGGGGLLAYFIAGATGAGLGKTVGEFVIDPNSLAEVGKITNGSPDTFIGVDRQKAARASFAAPRTEISCDPGEYVCQGSDTVSINVCCASRKFDGTSCGGLVKDGDPTVFVGGITTTVFQLGILPLDRRTAEYWVLGLLVDAAGMVGLPATRIGKVLYGLQALSLAESVAAGPAGEGSVFGPLADAGSPIRGTAEVIQALNDVDSNTGQNAMDVIGLALDIIQ